MFHTNKYIYIYLDPPRVSNFSPQVCFWWLRGSNFRPLEDSGTKNPLSDVFCFSICALKSSPPKKKWYDIITYITLGCLFACWDICVKTCVVYIFPPCFGHCGFIARTCRRDGEPKTWGMGRSWSPGCPWWPGSLPSVAQKKHPFLKGFICFISVTPPED